MKINPLLALVVLCLSSILWGMDVDVTYIDILPHYKYTDTKNNHDVGDPVTFVAHVKLYRSPGENAGYRWYLDGMTMGAGNSYLEPDRDNTISLDWIWDGLPHEIMIRLDPGDVLAEESEENNIRYDFTTGLTVGIAVERSLVESFPAFQRDLGIGSISFEDWFQRQIKIWNLILMEKAGELKSDRLIDIKDRVRGVLSYYEDGSLRNCNCPLDWKEVDMLWGKLATELGSYAQEKWKWFYEGSLPHELSHARYLPDTYIYNLSADDVHIVDDSGSLVTQTDYLPPFSWNLAYYDKNYGMMGGDYSGRYSLFNAYLFNRAAGRRALGCNTNGCCAHDTDWDLADYPQTFVLKILHLDGSPWDGARLDVYKREGHYSGVSVNNTVDYTLFTGAGGRAELPSSVFTKSSYEFILKISSPDEKKREYRMVENTDFHMAFWQGVTEEYEYTIKTDFDPVPYVEMVESVQGHDRGERLKITFRGRNFKEGGFIRFSNSNVKVNRITLVDSTELKVNLTLPENIREPRIRYRLYNPDGKFFRVRDPYQQEIHLNFNNRKPYAHFTSFPVGEKMPDAVYFNGLWSHDWAALFKEPNGPFPLPGTGPIQSYEWDFGDGTPVSSQPYLVHQYDNSGSYTVTLRVSDSDFEKASVSRTVVFGDVPEIGFEPSSLSFLGGGVNAGPVLSRLTGRIAASARTPKSIAKGLNSSLSKILAINNTGAGRLNYSIEGEAGWLSVSPSTGTSTGEGKEHVVSVDTSALPPGQYAASLVITAYGASNTPQTVPVTLTIPEILPPLNFSGQQVLNRSLSQGEYINVLEWQPNPENANIAGYRLYLKEGEDYVPLRELGPSIHAYLHRAVDNTRTYAYALVAVDGNDREGLPAYLIL
jgi:hypothetical protein